MKIKYSVFWAVAAVFLGGACLPVYADDEIKSEEPVSAESLESLEKAAEAGDVEAQERLIKIYGNGEEGVSRDYNKVFYWSGKAAENASAKGFYGLAACYLLGVGVEQDSQKFLYYAEKAASLGYVRAEAMLGGVYVVGNKGIEPDIGKARMHLKNAAESGDPEGMANYGVLLQMLPPEPGESEEENKILGEKYIYMSAQSGDPMGQYNLAALYDKGGYSIKKDQKESLKWLAKSARQDNPKAICQFCLSVFGDYRSSFHEIIFADFTPYATQEEAFSWLKAIAENREPARLALFEKDAELLSCADANAYLSEFYRQGVGVEKNIPLAKECLGRAVDEGCSFALWLATLDFPGDPDYPGDKIRRYAEIQIAIKILEAKDDPSVCDKLMAALHRSQSLRGVKGSRAEVFAFAQIPQANGASPARSFFLGLCYENGYGVDADREKAIEYYLQGAEKNDPLSMRNLGKLYFETGDTESALKWYSKAAELGDNISKEILEKIPQETKDKLQE
ncbi:MAG: sel1 repeat family protein [Opitutae bacterium]|nr:sel1 repeat family protein [Opitutae bacterium]